MNDPAGEFHHTFRPLFYLLFWPVAFIVCSSIPSLIYHHEQLCYGNNFIALLCMVVMIMTLFKPIGSIIIYTILATVVVLYLKYRKKSIGAGILFLGPIAYVIHVMLIFTPIVNFVPAEALGIFGY
jgi:hypothetical protein